MAALRGGEDLTKAREEGAATAHVGRVSARDRGEELAGIGALGERGSRSQP